MQIGGSIFVFAIGAILAFAVQLDPSPIAGMTVQWDTVGVILMIVGVVGLLWSLMLVNSWRDRRAPVVERQVERDRFVE